LELVAEKNGSLAGHILFSRLWIEAPNANGERIAAVALAPLAVAPDCQRQGIGAALIVQAHVILRERGEAVSVVIGDPAYYGRFGYRIDLAAGLQSDFPPYYVQAVFFDNDADVTGRMVYAAAFGDL